eukprot:sb/3469894/
MLTKFKVSRRYLSGINMSFRNFGRFFETQKTEISADFLTVTIYELPYTWGTGQCVLKMDHHCPWVGNCVGYSNYKYFVLFLNYTVLYTGFIALCCIPYLTNVWEHRSDDPLNFHVLIMFLISLVFCLTVFGLFVFHIYLLVHNRTTLESSRPPCFRGGFADAKRYDLGGCNNFKQVFGDNPLLWPFPVFSSIGDGVQFETRAYTNTNTDVPAGAQCPA